MKMPDEQFIMDNVNIKKLKGKVLKLKLMSFFIFIFLICGAVLGIIKNGIPNRLANLLPCIIIMSPIVFYFVSTKIDSRSIIELIFEQQGLRIVTLTGVEVKMDYSNLTFTEGKSNFVFLQTMGRSPLESGLPNYKKLIIIKNVKSKYYLMTDLFNSGDLIGQLLQKKLLWKQMHIMV